MMNGSIWHVCLYFIVLAFVVSTGPVAWVIARISTGRRIPFSRAFHNCKLSIIAATAGFWGADLIRFLVNI